MREFNLSERIRNKQLHAYNVKEFIKRQLCVACQKHSENNCSNPHCNRIKKDAGDKLL